MVSNKQNFPNGQMYHTNRPKADFGLFIPPTTSPPACLPCILFRKQLTLSDYT